MRKISTISGPDPKKLGFIMSYIKHKARAWKMRARKLRMPLYCGFVGKKISGWILWHHMRITLFCIETLCCINQGSYLISNAALAVVYLFQAGVLFSIENAIFCPFSPTLVILLQIYALFGVLFEALIVHWCNKIDQYVVWHLFCLVLFLIHWEYKESKL